MLANPRPSLARAGFVAGSTVLVLTCRAWLAIALGILVIVLAPAPAALAVAAGVALAAALMPYRSARDLHRTFRAVRGRETLPFMRGLLLALFAGLSSLWIAMLAFVEVSSGLAGDAASIPGVLAPRVVAVAVLVSVGAAVSAGVVWWRHPAVAR